MTKRFCDRCGKEADKLKAVKLSCGNSSLYGIGNYKDVSVELCEECQKETGIFEFIEKHRFERPIKEKSDQDKFFELFREMCTEAMNE